MGVKLSSVACSLVCTVQFELGLGGGGSCSAETQMALDSCSESRKRGAQTTLVDSSLDPPLLWLAILLLLIVQYRYTCMAM